MGNHDLVGLPGNVILRSGDRELAAFPRIGVTDYTGRLARRAGMADRRSVAECLNRSNRMTTIEKKRDGRNGKREGKDPLDASRCSFHISPECISAFESPNITNDGFDLSRFKLRPEAWHFFLTASDDAGVPRRVGQPGA